MNADLLQPLKDLLGKKGYIDQPGDMERYLREWRGRYHGKTPLIARPKSTDEVASVLRHCYENGIAVVPQGGHTGLCGGAMPDQSGSQIVLSLERMNTVREIDPGGYTMTVEAGCILADIQQAAKDKDRYFPLSLAAEGSSQIGGNLATNAGGVNVLHYGNARDLVLGLEVVLPDGRIWEGLRALRKDNTGYDLKQLFIGSEGTLGVITAAVLRLFPYPHQRATAFCALKNLDDVVELLAHARELSGDRVTSFELISRAGLALALKHMDQLRDPLEEPHEWYVLFELSTAEQDEPLEAKMAQVLEAAFEEELVVDGAVSRSESQSLELWRLRESLSEAQKLEGASIKHDVAVPVGKVPAFIREATEAVKTALPGVRPVPFGHVGDGNVHFNLSCPEDMDGADFLDKWDDISAIVHDLVARYGGSISAEHGIGQMKVGSLPRYKSAVEIDMMRTIKQALDPKGLMNPGKVVPPHEAD